MHRGHGWSGCVLIALASTGAGAQTKPLSADDSIVVTASRTGEGAAASVTTLDAVEIARVQPRSLVEALNDVAGVRAVSTGGPGGGSFVSVRGGEPNFTLVLIDGIRVNDPTNSAGGAFDFTQIDPALVERVEISREAGSAIHGSDALSGVIDIRLREATPGAARLTAQGSTGTDGARGAGAGLTAGWGGGGVTAAGRWFDSGTDDPRSTLRRAQGLLRVRQAIGGLDVRAIGLYAHTDRAGFPEDSGGPRYAVNRTLERGHGELRLVGLTVRGTRGVVRPDLTLSYAGQEDDTVTPAIAPGALTGVPAITARNRVSRLEATGNLIFERGMVTATAGGGLRRERGRSDGTITFGFPLPVRFALDRTIASGFAEATLRPAKGLMLNAAGHYDAVADGPHAWTGRAAVAWRPALHGPTLFARAGSGFKLPSFYALGHPLVGNPALRPERSRTIEAGADWAWSDGSVRVALYENRFRDLIDFDPVLFKTVNRASVRVRGVEVEGRWRVARAVEATVALGHLAMDSATPLRNRPRWQGSAHLAWRLNADLEVNAAARFNSSFADSSVPTGPVLAAGHVEADTGLTYRLMRHLDAALTLRNLGDSRYEDAVGFPSRGRDLRLTLAAGF